MPSNGFTLHHKARILNSHLQRQLAAKCMLLEKEKCAVQKRHTEARVECAALLRNLHDDSVRYGIVLPRKQPQRPKSTVSIVRDSNSNSFRPPKWQCDRPEDQVTIKATSDHTVDDQLYKFEKQMCNSQDTDSYIVYHRDESKRTSAEVLFFRRSSVEVSKVKTHTGYTNRSRRESVFDSLNLRFPDERSRQRKPRSMSFSGSMNNGLLEAKEVSIRRRSATVGNSYQVGKSMQKQFYRIGDNKRLTSMKRYEQISRGTPPAMVVPNVDKQVLLVREGELTEDDNHVRVNPGSNILSSVHKVDTETPQRQQNLRSKRRMSVPAMDLTGRVARSSFEARKLRSQSLAITSTIPAEDELKLPSNSDSVGSDISGIGIGLTYYLSNGDHNLLSSLKLSDKQDCPPEPSDQKGSQKWSTLDGGMTNVTNTKNSSNKGKDDSCDISSIIASNKPPRRNTLSENSLVCLLMRPQAQLQSLIKTLKEAHRAAERADRLKQLKINLITSNKSTPS